jgi:hypothetical protein
VIYSHVSEVSALTVAIITHHATLLKMDTCLGPAPFVDQWICTAKDLNMLWDWKPIDDAQPAVVRLTSRVDPSFCLHRANHGPAQSSEEAATHLKLAKCDASVVEQQWEVDDSHS